jgi:hypothetical protein
MNVRPSRLNVRPYLVVAVLLLAWPIQGFAKEAPAARPAVDATKGEHDKGSKGADQPAPRGQGRAIDRKSGHEGTPKDETSKGGSPATKAERETQPKGSKESEPAGIGPIETPTPEQPNRVVQPPVKIVPPKALSRPTNSVPDSGVVVRNAVGVGVAQPSTMGRAGPITGNIRAVPKSQQAGSPAIYPAGNRGLDGTALGRHGPAIVSGGSKPLAQINGSTIRLKH